MPVRFALFVDGSNLFGTMKHLDIKVDDYEALFRFIFEAAADSWRCSLYGQQACQTQLHRIYWYVVANIDRWTLSDPKAQTHLRNLFDSDKELHRPYMAEVGPDNPGADKKKLRDEAWALCSRRAIEWYDAKISTLEGMKKFYHAVEASTDYIQFVRSGHWKADVLYRSLAEKGIDTALAVDMLALQQTYDVAVVLSGDADMLPSISHIQRQGKHVASVEFLKGYPPEAKGKQYSSQLRLASDFVVRVYEMDLVQKNLAKKSGADPSPDAIAGGPDSRER